MCCLCVARIRVPDCERSVTPGYVRELFGLTADPVLHEVVHAVRGVPFRSSFWDCLGVPARRDLDLVLAFPESRALSWLQARVDKLGKTLQGDLPSAPASVVLPSPSSPCHVWLCSIQRELEDSACRPGVLSSFAELLPLVVRACSCVLLGAPSASSGESVTRRSCLQGRQE